MSPKQFLDKLEQQGLLDPKLIENLRRQVAQATSSVSAQAIAKLLVEKRQITAYQAKRLLESGAEEATESEELGFADEEEAADEDVVDLAPADKPAKATPPPPTQRKQAPGAPKKSAEATARPKTESGGAKADTSGKPVPLTEADLAPGPEDAGLVPLGDDDIVPLDESNLVSSGEADLVPLDDADLVPADEIAAVPGGIDSDDPFAGAVAAEGLSPLSAAGPAEGELGFEGKRKRRENIWDSPWLLIGGTMLLIFLGTGAFLFFILSRASADDLFKAAEESYKSQSYSEAIERYSEFLDEYDDHQYAPEVRVRRALARLWMAYASQNWEVALEAAQKHLPEIEQDLADVPDARDELATILPGIARGFTDQASAAGRDAARAQIYYDQAQEAMKLVNDAIYIPTDLRENPAIKNVIIRIEDDLAVVRRGIEREQRLASTIKEMKSLSAEGKTAEAFQIRKQLLQDYPSLENDPALAQATQDVALSERELVKTVKSKIASTQQDRPQGVSAVFASRTGKTIDSLVDRVVVVLVRGAHYGLDAGTGRVLWRRFVGYETQSHPARLSPDRGADVLLVDGQNNEIMRVGAADGELRWRLPLEEPFLDSVIASHFILVPTESGRLIRVDPQTGESTLAAKLPENQTIHVGPGFAEGKPYLYQTGTHSNLYILSASEMECRDVFYLGHKAGTIDVPPVLLGEQVLIIENSGARDSVLRVFGTEQRGLKLDKPQDPIPLEGHVVRPPIVMGDKVLIATKMGAVYVFEPDFSKRDVIPLKESAAFGRRFDDPVVGYPAVLGFHVWVADSRLTKFEFQPALEKLESIWLRNEGDSYVAPLQVINNVVVSVRRPRGQAGIAVAASDGISGEPLWQTHLGVPMAGDLAVVDREIIAVSAQGKLFKADDAVLEAGYRDQSTFRLNVEKAGLSLEHRVDFEDGRTAFTGPPGGKEFLAYDPADMERPLRLVSMKIGGRAATGAVAFDGRLLVPSSDGLVYCLDARTGEQAIKPFHPPLEAEANTRWQLPALVGEARFVIADGRGILYLVAEQAEPEPHLDSIATAQTPAEIVAPPAVNANFAYVAVRGGTTDLIQSFSLPKLELHKEQLLDGRVEWGPYRAGDKVLVASTGEGLVCFDTDGSTLWTAPLSYGKIAGQPLLLEGNVVLASQSGVVWRIAADTGEELGSEIVGERLATGAVPFGDNLVVAGADGVVHRLPVPKKTASSGSTP